MMHVKLQIAKLFKIEDLDGMFDTELCSTSPSGGNQVDGLPPVRNNTGSDQIACRYHPLTFVKMNSLKKLIV